MSDTAVEEHRPHGRADARRHRDRPSRRRRFLVLVVLGSTVLTGAGVVTATFVKSPAQAAADTRPPAPSVLTAPVQKKVLSDTVITRGKVAASQRLDVSGEGVGEKSSGRSVVTKAPVRTGQPLRMGQLLLEISGRPVFVLRGEVPSYRDLGPGSTGQDVSQLQQALAGLGYGSGNDRAGTFGPGTEAAVTRFYRAHGHAPAQGQPAPLASTQNPAGKDEAEERGVGDEARRATPTVTVPMAEIVYVRAEPAFIDQAHAEVGDDARGELISVSAGKPIVEGSVRPDLKRLVKPGMKVSIASEVTGSRAAGEVEYVAAKPTEPEKGSEQAADGSYAIKVKPTTTLPADLVGEDVRLTITAASSKKPVLAVPTAAVSAGEDGHTTVTVLRGQREVRTRVDTGMAADGYVEVSPAEGSRLAVGDRVIVGTDERRPVTGS
ncbi:peptidoglycan-binding protein [Streptomyces parvus]|uniref:peptidoglycan-binding protein n=1 Tax=Streptomyces parvus TaxID=66428 RepID=UPI0037FD75F9